MKRACMMFAAFLLLTTTAYALPLADALPEGYVCAAPHTVWTFETVTGVTHTIALSDYDPSHDAVTVDGASFFSMQKNALTMEIEE